MVKYIQTIKIDFAFIYKGTDQNTPIEQSAILIEQSNFVYLYNTAKIN